MFQRALCCFPGFTNPGTTSRKGKISKPLLAGVVGEINSPCSTSTGSSKSRLLDETCIDDTSTSSSSSRLINQTDAGRPEDMMLLEKQGRSSQRQRMQEGEQRRAGSLPPSNSLPPSSLPRPPRSIKSTTSRYCRLSDGETRKKSDPGPEINDYGRFEQRRTRKMDIKPVDSYELLETRRVEGSKKKIDTKHRENQGRSLIPPPSRRIGEYGRLSDGDTKILRKSGSRGVSTGSTTSTKSTRDSGGTGSNGSVNSLPPIKGRSIPRPNYRIQF
uniref:Uncharacterized protein n=1 Tax=Bracon brevicornis TaxID=1563983 RepID=A0A6V7IL45_9HYME